jgi:hypothetical protein
VRLVVEVRLVPVPVPVSVPVLAPERWPVHPPQPQAQARVPVLPAQAKAQARVRLPVWQERPRRARTQPRNHRR